MDRTDAEVMVASVDDPTAFALVFDRHVMAVHRVLARRLGPAGGDDLTGEVFRIAFESRRLYDPSYSSAPPQAVADRDRVERDPARGPRRATAVGHARPGVR